MNNQMEEFNRRQIARANTLAAFAHLNQVTYQGQTMDPNIFNPQKEERQRCIAILEEEIERGRKLLGLLDQAGRPIFDDKTTMACMEAIDYCIKRLRAME